jgi:hypothetical protein
VIPLFDTFEEGALVAFVEFFHRVGMLLMTILPFSSHSSGD